MIYLILILKEISQSLILIKLVPFPYTRMLHISQITLVMILLINIERAYYVVIYTKRCKVACNNMRML